MEGSGKAGINFKETWRASVDISEVSSGGNTLIFEDETILIPTVLAGAARLRYIFQYWLNLSQLDGSIVPYPIFTFQTPFFPSRPAGKRAQVVSQEWTFLPHLLPLRQTVSPN